MNKKGFTLVELLAVIAILAILVIIAMPNVLEMFNKAKQDAFETEVKTHVKAVANEFIMTGKLVYSNVVEGAHKLPMDGEELDYYIRVDSQGNIKELNVTNGDYKIEATGSSSNPIKVEQIGETIKSETAKSGEEFAMDSTGDITGESMNGPKLNEYGFYYDVRYEGTDIRDGFIDSKRYFIFKEDGTVRMWEELGEQDYYANKESMDGDMSVNNYEDAKATWNYIWGDKVNGMVTDNTTYSKSYVFVDYEKYNGSVTFKYQLNIYFSEDGRTIYLDEGRVQPIAYYR